LLQFAPIRFYLRSHEELAPPSLSLILLARSFGLIPMLIILPTKILLTFLLYVFTVKEALPHTTMESIFYPPLSAILTR